MVVHTVLEVLLEVAHIACLGCFPAEGMDFSLEVHYMVVHYLETSWSAKNKTKDYFNTNRKKIYKYQTKNKIFNIIIQVSLFEGRQGQGSKFRGARGHQKL
jgi:isoprenylcysteine carboxyl methyltransferase (ICMT) family protein YpbQ